MFLHLIIFTERTRTYQKLTKIFIESDLGDAIEITDYTRSKCTFTLNALIWKLKRSTYGFRLWSR